jgi:hypothetical protein
VDFIGVHRIGRPKRLEGSTEASQHLLSPLEDVGWGWAISGNHEPLNQVLLSSLVHIRLPISSGPALSSDGISQLAEWRMVPADGGSRDM